VHNDKTFYGHLAPENPNEKVSHQLKEEIEQYYKELWEKENTEQTSELD